MLFLFQQDKLCCHIRSCIQITNSNVVYEWGLHKKQERIKFLFFCVTLDLFPGNFRLFLNYQKSGSIFQVHSERFVPFLFSTLVKFSFRHEMFDFSIQLTTQEVVFFASELFWPGRLSWHLDIVKKPLWYKGEIHVMTAAIKY